MKALFLNLQVKHVGPMNPGLHSQNPLDRQVPLFSQAKVPPDLQPKSETNFYFYFVYVYFES